MQSQRVLSTSRASLPASPVLARTQRLRYTPCRAFQGPQQQQQSTKTPSAPPASQQVTLSKQQLEAILPQPGAVENMPNKVDTKSLGVLENWAESYAMPDEMSMWDDGDYVSSRRDLQLAYVPPKSDLPGLSAALSLIFCWVSWAIGCATEAHMLSAMYALCTLLSTYCVTQPTDLLPLRISCTSVLWCSISLTFSCRGNAQ